MTQLGVLGRTRESLSRRAARGLGHAQAAAAVCAGSPRGRRPLDGLGYVEHNTGDLSSMSAFRAPLSAGTATVSVAMPWTTSHVVLMVAS